MLAKNKKRLKNKCIEPYGEKLASSPWFNKRYLVGFGWVGRVGRVDTAPKQIHGTEMAGQGPQRGGVLVLRLGRTDGAPLEEVCLVGSEGWSELTRPLNKSMAP